MSPLSCLTEHCLIGLTTGCRQGPSDADFRGRFKVIATVKNMEQLDLPGFISNYNSKPVLITKSGTLCRGDGYCEMDIRVHRSVGSRRVLVTGSCGVGCALAD